jgi:hypothetical protein
LLHLNPIYEKTKTDNRLSLTRFRDHYPEVSLALSMQ